ncbi:UNVERIFIED_ORG: isocitrate/isopropylmalate dehydrogenase [Arthrobacter globiformis]|nr:isocitrate/isopropylmalate dehydrogenase [Arthrobacter globiformis]
MRTMPFWDEVIAETVGEYPTATPTSELVDALAAQTPWGRAGPAR